MTRFGPADLTPTFAGTIQPGHNIDRFRIGNDAETLAHDRFETAIMIRRSRQPHSPKFAPYRFLTTWESERILTRKPATVVTALAVALMAGQIALMAVPAVIVDLTQAWSLDAAQIGWLGGIYFAGYAAGLPFLAGAAGRMDGRIVYGVSAVIAAGASLGFATLAHGFWTGLVLRFIGGIGFAGIHIVGMKLMADRLTGTAQARAGALYSAAYAVGSGISFLIAGPVA